MRESRIALSSTVFERRRQRKQSKSAVTEDQILVDTPVMGSYTIRTKPAHTGSGMSVFVLLAYVCSNLECGWLNSITACLCASVELRHRDRLQSPLCLALRSDYFSDESGLSSSV
jgi:hypothetical protein